MKHSNPSPASGPLDGPEEAGPPVGWSGRIRGMFPYLEEDVNGRAPVYLDSAASSQKPSVMLQRVQDFLQREYANVHRGIHRHSERATMAYEDCRQLLAEFLGAREQAEIVFTSGTTAGVNLLARSLGETVVNPGDRILLTEMEHHGNLLPWQEMAARRGASIDYVPVLENGAGLDLASARGFLQKKPRIFAFAHVSNTLGVENPAGELCRLAREQGVLSVVDAAQSLGHQPVDVGAMGCDFLVGSAHKMCGPSGIGVLYGRMELLQELPPASFGGDMVLASYWDRPAVYREPPARFEAGTPPILEAAAWAASIRFLQEADLSLIHRHGVRLARMTANRLGALPGVRCLGPENRKAPLVTFTVDGIHAHDLVFFCDRKGVSLRAGHHCAQPLMRKLGAPSSARASFYLYNTEEEVDWFLATVQEAITFFR
jgi:cysteine desulfurase/selenocysteine lyase